MFGEYLKKTRKEKGLTVSKLAELSGLSQGFLSNIENGVRKPPSPDLLRQLVKPLETTFLNLMEEAGYVEQGKDKINPDHYKTGGIETIEIIKAKLTKEAFQGYLTGNIFKYVSRYNHKNGLEDLKKAQWYLNRLIQEIES